MLKRVGMYLWAGPGTERIIKTKYFSPKIDRKSLYESYDYDYLARAKEIFGITDVWVTYSWGFSENTEKEDYEFIESRVKNFRKLKLKVHAYIQGTNLVYNEFLRVDWWARDEKQRLITYYKGRKVTCPNNPGFQDYIFKKIAKVAKKDFDGIYVDNIQMGQLGIPSENNKLLVFSGCRCKYCQSKFQKIYGASIPKDLNQDQNLTNKFLDFRSESTELFVSQISKIIKNMDFGTNSYDPKFDGRIVYGFEPHKLAKYQTYLFFENHSIHRNYIDNSYIDANFFSINKPVFVLSYKNGIGFEKQFNQHTFDLIFSEAKSSKFFPCIKGSEYVTKKSWHNLNLDKLKKPKRNIPSQKHQASSRNKTLRSLLEISIFRYLLKEYYNPIFTLVMENWIARKLLKPIYRLALH